MVKQEDIEADSVLGIKTQSEFNARALKVFRFQAANNNVYKNFLSELKINPSGIHDIKQIPFLPIEFFKTQRIITTKAKNDTGRQKLFLSSGTTGGNHSRHFVNDISVYEKSFENCFELFYGKINDYCILGLLPSYLERSESSLVYMVGHLINKTSDPNSGFYLNDFDALSKKIELLERKKQKTLLLGVSYALLDFSEKFKGKLKHTIIMETGGMKGRRKELVRQDLHQRLCNSFGVKKIHSEYGMTELLSQAYSSGGGIFYCPPWMKILIREPNDYFQFMDFGLSGGINIIDLANFNSCSFIATQDLGKLYPDGSFEVLGRFDNSDLRGCNLLFS